MGRMRYFALVGAVVGILALRPDCGRADGYESVVGVTDLQAATDWTGFYIGGKLGGAWSNVDWTQDVNVFTAGGAVPPGTGVSFGPSGVAGGIIGGGNVQVGHWIFGAELSFSGTDLSETLTSPFFPATDTFQTEIGWIGTIEGRIGYAWDRFLLFGKGGWAGANASLTLTNSATGVTATTDEFVDGWTIGGGLEYMCWPSVVLGIEYDYVTLNLSNAPSCPLCVSGIVAGAPSSITGEATASTVMVRASYLFVPED